VAWKGVAELDAALERLVAKIDVETGEAMKEDVAEVLKRKVRPTHEVTGNLGNSMTVEARPRGFGDWYAQAGPTLVYTRISVLGHRKTPSRPSYRKPDPWFFERWPGAVVDIREVFRVRWARVLRGHL
jgi:hypothetical protein